MTVGVKFFDDAVIGGAEVRLLMVEDLAADVDLAKFALQRAGVRFTLRVASAEGALRAALAQEAPDLVLSDFSLPGFDGMTVLRIVRELCPATPLIFVSGTVGEEVAIEALKSGAVDYILKSNLLRLPVAVERALHDARDQAGRRQITRALHESEAGLRRAQIMTGLAHVITGPEGEFESWSETLPPLAGVEPARMPRSTREWLDLVHSEDRARFRASSLKAAATRERTYVEYRLNRADGRLIYVHQMIEPLGVEPGDGDALRWFSTLQDFTEQKRITEELGTATRRLDTLREKERRDLARELHDRVGQNLTALSVNLAQLQGEMKGRDAAARIADCQALVEATGQIVQNVLTELKPPMLANYGLADAVRWQAREFTRRTGVAVEVSAAGAEQRLGAVTELALFRITQSALNNVAQHARAKCVHVLLELRGDRVRYEIRDDGVGFDAGQALASGRWGLTAMRERAELIEGSLRIESAPGQGAKIVVEAPIG